MKKEEPTTPEPEAPEKDEDDWDCGCPEGSEEKCRNVMCPRQ